MTKIKICGITRMEDALAAAEYGADWLGFIFFHGSPRNIAAEKAREIIDEVRRAHPRIKAVGVFVKPSLQEVKGVVDATGIDMVQLHACEREGEEEARRVTGLEIIAAMRIKDCAPVERIAKTSAEYVLFDAADAKRHGGTGRTIPIALLGEALEAAGGKRVIVAGGIGEENIDEILALEPYGVDINSKVEMRPGVKDHEKMKRIITRIRERRT